MTSKVGPDLESHPKIRHAWSIHHTALGLHLLGLSFAQRTGGFVSVAFVNEKVPAKRERDLTIAALTTVAPGEENPMWAAVEGGWRIHNFEKHAEFRTPEEADELHDKRAEAGRLGAAKRWQVDSKPDGNLPSTGHEVANGKTEFAIGDVVKASSSEVGTDKTTASKKTSQMANAIYEQLCRTLADAVYANDPKANISPGGKDWLTAARLLVERDKRTVEEIEAVIAWSQAHHFWRINVQSMPTLRKQFSRLWLGLQSGRTRSASQSSHDANTDRRLAAARDVYRGEAA